MHRHINPHFTNRSRIGLPLALALLTILIFNHNRSIEEKLTGNQLPSIRLWRYHHDTTNPLPVFGIQKKDINIQGISWIASPVVNIASLSSTSLHQACMSASLGTDISDLVAIEDIFRILENATCLCKIAVSMQKQSLQSPAFNYKFLPLMSSVASIFFDPQPAADEHGHSK